MAAKTDTNFARIELGQSNAHEHTYNGPGSSPLAMSDTCDRTAQVCIDTLRCSVPRYQRARTAARACARFPLPRSLLGGDSD